jgi:hypothetical protein
MNHVCLQEPRKNGMLRKMTTWRLNSTCEPNRAGAHLDHKPPFEKASPFGQGTIRQYTPPSICWGSRKNEKKRPNPQQHVIDSCASAAIHRGAYCHDRLEPDQGVESGLEDYHLRTLCATTFPKHFSSGDGRGENGGDRRARSSSSFSHFE